MSFYELFDMAGLAFLIVTGLLMIMIRDLKASVAGGFIFSSVVLGNSIISFYVSNDAGSFFILLVMIVLVLWDNIKKPV